MKKLILLFAMLISLSIGVGYQKPNQVPEEPITIGIYYTGSDYITNVRLFNGTDISKNVTVKVVITPNCGLPQMIGTYTAILPPLSNRVDMFHYEPPMPECFCSMTGMAKAGLFGNASIEYNTGECQ